MPVLMNKGPEPRKAAWLFYTDRATLDALASAARTGRFDAGVLVVDEADLDAAPRASTVVPVHLAVASLVPEGFDLEAYIDEAGEQDDDDGGQDADGQGEEGGAEAEEPCEPAETEEPAADANPAAADEPESGADEPGAPYEPVPAPEGTRVPIGLTTAAAARAYIQPREVDGQPWAAELPGLPMLVSLIDYMRSHGGLPAFAVWHVDPQGIMRMAPAKTVRPMAGNILNVRL